MRAVVYARASLDRTGEGKSTSRQEEECRRLCEYKRWDVVAAEADLSISAYGDKERPAWKRVLSMVAAGEVDVIVAFHLDRLTRNMSDLETLILLCEEHDVLVATATGDIDLTNDTGRMVARILAAVARQEVERKAARQTLAHAQRRAEGRPWEAVKMLGYTRAGEVIEEEAQPIREAAQDVISGPFNLAAIGRRWRELGLTSPYQKDTTKPWTNNGVRSILLNPRVAGFVVQDGEILGKGNWEPIIDEHTFTLVAAKLNDRSRSVGKKSGRHPANLLSSIMTCAKCGERVTGGSKRGLPTYVCRNWHTQTPRAEADDLVRAAFASAMALSSPGAILGGVQSEVDPSVAEQEIVALRGRQEVLARSFARGVTSEQAYESAVTEIASQIEALKAQATSPSGDWRKVRAEDVRAFLAQPMDEQRRILERLAVIKMHPAGRGGLNAKRQLEIYARVKVSGNERLIPAHMPTQKAPQS